MIVLMIQDLGFEFVKLFSVVNLSDFLLDSLKCKF